MAVKPCILNTDVQQRQTDYHGTPMFPCGGYKTMVGGCITKCIGWHWHEEAEVIAVASGTLRLEVPDQTLLVRTGEAVFINASVLHSIVNADSCVCEIHSLVFDPKLIFGTLESAIEQKYVRPLISCPCLPVIHFKNETDWQRDAIRWAHEAFTLYQEEGFGHELFVREALSRLWLLMVEGEKSKLEQHQSAKNTEAVRVKEMLAYIHAHYAEPITLKDIAGAASVSERECSRCFNRVLGTTPMKYLLGHRVAVAAGLLAGSSLNITEICKRAGFESPSYFSLKFKALTELTPSEYRQREKSAA